MPDVLCPNCLEKGGLEISKTLQARPVGNFSLSGNQLKFSAVEVPKLACSLCEWAVIGVQDGPGHVKFPDPHA